MGMTICMEETTREVIRLLQDGIESLREESITADTPLISSGMIDSFNLVNFLPILEERFNIEFEIEELNFADFEYPRGISAMITKYIGKN